MTGKILNPVRWEDIESDMTEAEKQFTECLARGKPCIFGEKVPQEANPRNIVRGEVIRFFVYGGDEKHQVRGAGIFLYGAVIPDTLRLILMHTPYKLGFFHCRFDGFASLHRAECAAFLADHSHFATGLTANGLKTDSDVSLRGISSPNGGLSLARANIGGDLDCRGGAFINPGKRALDANNVKVDGHVILRELSDEDGERRFSADGEVCLLGARIGGTLACAAGTFNNPNGCAINAGRIEVDGDVLLTGGFSANGDVDMSVAYIGKSFVCDRAEFRKGLILRRAKIKDTLLWREVTGGGDVNLMFAQADILGDEMGSWKPFKVFLDGFTYDQIAGPTDAEARIKWLAKRPDDAPFSPQPYERAAKVLRDMGKSIDAWDIEREKRRLERAERDSNNALKVPLLRRLWGRTIDALTDFVYRPWKTLGWAVLIVLAGALLFDFADENGRMVPHQPVVLAHADYKAETIPPCAEFKCPPERRPTAVVKRLFPDYPEFNALVYSADVFIPFFALHQEPYWYPNPSDSDREVLLRILPLWYWLEIGAGWILTSLFLLSVTGVLRPRQSSGEKG